MLSLIHRVWLTLNGSFLEQMTLTVPYDGRVPEIKPLSLIFAEAKLRLEREWEIQQALKEIDGNEHNTVGEKVTENGSQSMLTRLAFTMA